MLRGLRFPAGARARPTKVGKAGTISRGCKRHGRNVCGPGQRSSG